MTDDLRPGVQSSDPAPGRDPAAEPDDAQLRVTAEELVTPHDQPAEGGVEEAEDDSPEGRPIA